MIHLNKPNQFSDYQLLDTGNFQKLERFGKYILIRPEPQAMWAPQQSMDNWKKQADAIFVAKSSSAGIWEKLTKNMPDQWTIQYKNNLGTNVTFRLGLTSFKHVGVFPEQASNWDFIAESVQKLEMEEPTVLNLFAYTGGASLVARQAGASVTHVDSIKQVVTWANENRILSNVDTIRWMVEDAMKFVQKEIRRGNKYNGIILDPPAYGHGANGESWKLEKDIQEMLLGVEQLLAEKHFMVLNTYSLGFSSLVIENLLYKHKENLIIGELYLPSKANHKLPLGVFGRVRNYAN